MSTEEIPASIKRLASKHSKKKKQKPTSAYPATEQKIMLLAQRAANGEPLNNPEDAKFENLPEHMGIELTTDKDGKHYGSLVHIDGNGKGDRSAEET